MKNMGLNIIVICFAYFFAQSMVFGGIVGSAHDFSTEGWSGGKICQPCHTPHTSDLSVSDAPLWDHSATTAAFSMYDSPTMVVQPETEPQGVSKLCLSCHDGTIALDSFGGNVGSENISGTADLTPDLSDDHPVSVQWKHQNDTAPCSNCHFAHGELFSSKLPFYNGFVECATCHDVHNSENLPKLLRKPMQSSEICFHCHGK